MNSWICTEEEAKKIANILKKRKIVNYILTDFEDIPSNTLVNLSILLDPLDPLYKSKIVNINPLGAKEIYLHYDEINKKIREFGKRRRKNLINHCLNK